MVRGTGVRIIPQDSERRENRGRGTNINQDCQQSSKAPRRLLAHFSPLNPPPCLHKHGHATHLILLPVLDPCLVGVVLEHGLAVSLLEHLVPNAVAVLLEAQNLVVRQLRNELGCEVVSEAEVRVFPDLLCGERGVGGGGGGSAFAVGVDPVMYPELT